MHPTPTPARVLLFHGLLSTPAEFGLICHPLRRSGIEVVAPVLQGYSHGGGRPAASWQAWVEQAQAALDEQASDGEDLYVGGLCSGALLALALTYPSNVKGLVLLSPLFSYDGWSLPWWYRLRSVAYLLGLSDYFSMPEAEPYGLKNERMRNWVKQQLAQTDVSAVGPSRLPLSAIRQSELLSRHVRRRLASIQQPVLALHAHEDEICSIEGARRSLRDLGAEQLRFVELQNSYHMITADNDRQQVVWEIQRFTREFSKNSMSTNAATQEDAHERRIASLY